MEKPNVLMVDDEPDILRVISARLQVSGFNVEIASCAKEAFAVISRNMPEIIILDIYMPGMDGYEVLQKLRQDNKTASVPVIMLSAGFSQVEKVKAFDLGADDYIVKPYEPEEFIRRINSLLKRSVAQTKKTEIKNILITGGAGFVGSHLAKELLAKDYHVSVLDDFSTGREDNIAALKSSNNFKLITGSVTDETILSKFIEQSDLIFHLAATVGVKNVVDNPLDTVIYDTFGTGLVLKYASANGVKVVLTSTSEVYGKSTDLPFSESGDLVMGSPDINRWSYACAKLLDEFLAIAYHKQRGLPVVVTRLFNVVGPRQVGKYGMVMPRFFKRAFKNEPITVYGDGEQVRCFTYIDDIVEILMELAMSEKANGEVVNLGSHNEISIKNLALKIKEITKSSSEIVFEPYSNYYGSHFQDIRKRVPDITKLIRIIGKGPKVGMDDILRRMKEHFSSHSEELDNI
ncbi:MAG: GDP-mannose 4,6-dehydratase [Candidatus Omnitrophota bacterium]